MTQFHCVDTVLICAVPQFLPSVMKRKAHPLCPWGGLATLSSTLSPCSPRHLIPLPLCLGLLLCLEVCLLPSTTV